MFGIATAQCAEAELRAEVLALAHEPPRRAHSFRACDHITWVKRHEMQQNSNLYSGLSEPAAFDALVLWMSGSAHDSFMCRNQQRPYTSSTRTISSSPV
jgi:hypothetical protein